MGPKGRRRGGTHRHTFGGRASSEHSIWHSMCGRCHNPGSKSYRYYGARGVRVCDAWRGRGGFARFIAHIGFKPTPEHTLDRIDASGHYEPGNVRWATMAEQSTNRRDTRRIRYEGRSQCLTEWAKELGIARTTLSNRLNSGWSVNRAFGTPARKKRCA